jgi:hypothetical protein
MPGVVSPDSRRARVELGPSSIVTARHAPLCQGQLLIHGSGHSLVRHGFWRIPSYASPVSPPILPEPQLRQIKMVRQTSLLFWVQPLARQTSCGTSANQRPTPGPELSLHVAAGVLSCLVRMAACAEFSLRRPRCHTTGYLLRARSGLFVPRDKQVLIPRAIP